MCTVICRHGPSATSATSTTAATIAAAFESAAATTPAGSKHEPSFGGLIDNAAAATAAATIRAAICATVCSAAYAAAHAATYAATADATTDAATADATTNATDKQSATAANEVIANSCVFGPDRRAHFIGRYANVSSMSLVTIV